MPHFRADQEISLPVLFERAQLLCEATETTITQPTQGQQASLQDAQNSLQQCEALVDSLGLFSANEEAEDIATGDLKYLLVPYYLAELQARTAETDPAVRSNLLGQAAQSYTRFLHTCDQYGLVPPEAKVDHPADPQTQRQWKIERFRKEKAAKARLAELQTAVARSRRLRELDAEDADSHGDSEREAWLTKTDLAVIRAAEQIGILRQELDLLSHAASLPDDHRSRPLPPPPADLLQQLQLAASNLESKRDQIRANVFRPSHNLPTRSLREQAENEVEQARQGAKAQAKAAERKAKFEADEEAVLQKQRAWDDWKDDNPRGAGNSKLRPTA